MGFSHQKVQGAISFWGERGVRKIQGKLEKKTTSTEVFYRLWIGG